VIHRIYTPVEVPRSPVFWLLYIMFVMVSGSGLMATTQIADRQGLRRGGYRDSVRRHDHHDRADRRHATAPPVRCSAGYWTISVVNIDGDRAFSLGALAYWLLGSLGTAPWAFVAFAAR
jgi:OFA family oxalate/formate antiporter-like MFS transporter